MRRLWMILLICCLPISAFGAKVYAPGAEIQVVTEEESLEVSKVGTVAVPSTAASGPGTTVSSRTFWEPHKNPGAPGREPYDPNNPFHGPGLIQWMSSKRCWEPVPPGKMIDVAGHVPLQKQSCGNYLMRAEKVKVITKTNTVVVPGETKYIKGPTEYVDRPVDRFVYVQPQLVQTTATIGSPTVQSLNNPINITPWIGDFGECNEGCVPSIDIDMTQDQAQSQSTAVEAGGDGGHGPCN